MQSKPTSSLKDTILGSICLVILLGAVVLVVGLVSKPSAPDPGPRSPQQTRTAPVAPIQRVPTIVATIQEFQISIPLLEQTGLSHQQGPGGIEYRWVSGTNSIQFYDIGSDGKLDRISATLTMPTDDPNATVLAAGLAFRLVQLASGKDVTMEEFSAWVASVSNGSAAHVLEGEIRTFNRTPMRLQGRLTTEGETGMRLTIGILN